MAYPGRFFTEANGNAAFTIDDWFLCTGVELRVQIKGKSPAGTCSWCPALAAVGRNLVESSEMTYKYVAKATLWRKMNGQLCTLFLICFSKTCCLAKVIKNFYGVLHSRPIFYTFRLHVMTKTHGRCLNEWPLALFAVMSQNFIWTWCTLT